MADPAKVSGLEISPAFLEAALHVVSMGKEPEGGLVGETLRSLREKAGMTIEGMAKAVGTSPEFVESVETGESVRPSSGYFSRVVQVLVGDTGEDGRATAPMAKCFYRPGDWRQRVLVYGPKLPLRLREITVE